MNIHLYNNFHNGDLLFNQPIVKNLCKNNKHHTFTMFCNYNSYIFSDISNLKIVYTMPYTYNGKVYEIINNNTLSLNLWCYALTTFKNVTGLDLDEIELNLPNIVRILKIVFNEIKSKHEIIINLDDYTEELYLPVIPSVNLDDFLKWYNNFKNKKLIFYYNYAPASGQKIPVTNHDEIIIKLSKKFPELIFILPKFTENIDKYISDFNTSNLVNCESTFNCKQDIDCINLCKLQKIIEYCDYSIHYDIGASFYFCNSNLSTSKNIPLYLTSNIYYLQRLQTLNVVKNKTIYFVINNENEAYLKLDEYLTYSNVN
jgi:hypothetical protein